jgi:hypothetical protein
MLNFDERDSSYPNIFYSCETVAHMKNMLMRDDDDN